MIYCRILSCLISYPVYSPVLSYHILSYHYISVPFHKNVTRQDFGVLDFESVPLIWLIFWLIFTILQQERKTPKNALAFSLPQKCLISRGYLSDKVNVSSYQNRIFIYPISSYFPCPENTIPLSWLQIQLLFFLFLFLLLPILLLLINLLIIFLLFFLLFLLLFLLNLVLLLLLLLLLLNLPRFV